MTDFDALGIYRRMFATAEENSVAWWYFGTSFAEIDNYPTVPVTHIETLLINKATTLSPDSFRIDWWEIGYMRDPTTGEIAQSWLNPITGKHVVSPDRFEEGPSHFKVQREGGGIRVDLVQAHARVESVIVNVSVAGDRVFIDQTERKIRGFPLPDGSMPSLDSAGVSSARTRLSMFADKADLGKADVPSSGSYEFQLASPPWMGFANMPGHCITRGIMVKAPMHHRLNPTAWDRMKSMFPECFDGDEVRPRWNGKVQATGTNG